MPIKTIVIYVDSSPASDDRVTLGLHLARKFDAYLIGAGMEEAVSAGDRFTARLAQDQVQGEWWTVVGLPASYLCRCACVADLVIIGQRQAGYPTTLQAPEDVVLGSGRPV